MRFLAAALALAAGCSGKADSPARTSSRLAAKSPAVVSATVTVAGSVIERDTGDPVADVEVVLRGEHGDVSARSHGDGAFSVVVPRGTYRAFVRDARVISTAPEPRKRVRGIARAELAGAADEQLMSVLVVDDDIKGLELPVVAAGIIEGLITNDEEKPVENAIVAAVPVEDPAAARPPATGGVNVPVRHLRPVLGTDTVISDAAGAFVLRVPPGRYQLLAEHPAYAGLGDMQDIEVLPGTRENVRPVLWQGCILSGKVVGAGGTAPHDGALEVSIDGGRFAPIGRIHPDGTFRWATNEESDIELRAWPWQSAPSPTRTFACDYGKRFDKIVLRASNEAPDLVGTIVDAADNSVPLAYLDITPLDRGVEGQQERADASGHFEVYELPAGRYQLTASAIDRGMVSTMVVAPRNDVSLQLGGTGRIAGTTTDLIDGSFEIVFQFCGGASNFVELDEEPHLVVVRGGRFSIDHVPACALTYTAQWRDRTLARSVVVEPERTATIELELGKPRQKTVHGVVRDSGGKPVANAHISALVDNEEVASVRAADDGTFELKTPGGAELVASNGKRVGRGNVGRANVATEQVELVLDERAGAQ